MIWGDSLGLANLHPAKLAYGRAHDFAEERAALETSVAAGVTLFDTAEIYSGGASERRLGELARGTTVVLATKIPPGILSRAEMMMMPKELDASIARAVACGSLSTPLPANRVSIPQLMDLMAATVEAGKIRAVVVSTYWWEGSGCAGSGREPVA